MRKTPEKPKIALPKASQLIEVDWKEMRDEGVYERASNQDQTPKEVIEAIESNWVLRGFFSDRGTEF